MLPMCVIVLMGMCVGGGLGWFGCYVGCYIGCVCDWMCCMCVHFPSCGSLMGM